MNIPKKHLIIGGLIIAVSFAIQPFSLLLIQNSIAPVLAEKFMGQNIDGSVSNAGKEIKIEDMKIRGNKDAKIFLVEFSDYQCPFCGRFHDVPKEIVNKSAGEVAWVWKHYPLTQIHPEAKPAAIAAECVFKIGGNDKFWAYSDMLITNQANLNANLYKAEAAKMGINPAQFNTCINDPSVAAEIDANQAEGEALQVSGTPATFVAKMEDGKLVILEEVGGAVPLETVQGIVDEYVK